MQAERRKKKLVYFLSRGAAYLGQEVKDKAERRKKKLVYFLSRGAAYLQAPLAFKRSLKLLFLLHFVPFLSHHLQNSTKGDSPLLYYFAYFA